MALSRFKKGQSGNPAGRTPGSKNKLNTKVDEICQAQGCNPFEVLAQIAANTLKHDAKGGTRGHIISIRLRLEAAAELAQYLAPKLKAIEVSTDPANPVQFIMNFSKKDAVQCHADSE